MRVGQLKKVKPVHVALLVASALYLIAGTAGAEPRGGDEAETHLVAP